MNLVDAEEVKCHLEDGVQCASVDAAVAGAPVVALVLVVPLLPLEAGGEGTGERLAGHDDDVVRADGAGVQLLELVGLEDVTLRNAKRVEAGGQQLIEAGRGSREQHLALTAVVDDVHGGNDEQQGEGLAEAGIVAQKEPLGLDGLLGSDALVLVRVVGAAILALVGASLGA